MPGQALIENGSEKQAKKKVFATTTTAIKAGHAFCYERNSTTGGAVTTAQLDRATRVELPATDNIKWFAGLASRDYPANSAGQHIEIVEPDGHLAEGFTNASTTAGTTALYLVPDSFILQSSGAVRVGTAHQTVDRSTTNGTVMMQMEKPSEFGNVVTASARTTVQLPTAAIWDNFDLAELRANPFAGALLDTDFRHDDNFPTQTFTDTSSTILPSNAVVGELVLLATADNEAAEVQWLVPITATGGANWALECRFKVSSITTEKGSFEIGLSNAQVLAGDLQADGGALPTTGTDYLIFNHDAAATTALDLDYLLSGQTHTEHDAAALTLTTGYHTVGLYYNGTTIAQYADGVVVADPILAADIVDGNFPAAQVMVPTIGIKAAHTDDYTLTLDWIRVAQAPA